MKTKFERLANRKHLMQYAVVIHVWVREAGRIAGESVFCYPQYIPTECHPQYAPNGYTHSIGNHRIWFVTHRIWTVIHNMHPQDMCPTEYRLLSTGYTHRISLVIHSTYTNWRICCGFILWVYTLGNICYILWTTNMVLCYPQYISTGCHPQYTPNGYTWCVHWIYPLH